MYRLTKLSSGTTIELTTDEVYIVTSLLKECTCQTCLAEAELADSPEEFLDALLMSSCGAEFHLEEYEESE